MKLQANQRLANRIAVRVSLASLLLLSLTVLSPIRPVFAQSSALQLNDSGEAVSELQQQLLDLGYYNGEITGFYGAMTQEAVARFQQSLGLDADGIVGAATQSALDNPAGQTASSASASAPQPLVRLNDSGAQIVELQKRLTDLGFYSGSISGSFDRLTEEAVSRFQEANGLPVDGIVGPATEVALRQPAGVSPARSSSGSASSNSGVSNSSAGILRLGDTGATVSELQARLTDKGFYRSPVTGNYDAQTQSAVIAFQRSQGLIPDGIAGPQVATALGISTSSPQASSTPQNWQQIQQARAEAQQAKTQAEQAKRDTEQARLEAEQARLVLNQNLQEGRYSVAELQRHLKTHGYTPGEINGILTPDTRTAIIEAQRRYGLSDSDLFEGSLP
jgi:peptidoglycan hydrolase-like protein with peptidoglycan-binding domain